MKSKGSPLADKHWVVRAGRGAVHASEFLEHGIVALGLAAEVGAAALAMDRERLLKATSARRPDWSPKRAAAQGNQLARFIHEMQVGDRVATYDGERRVFYVGTIEGPATFDEGRIAGQPFVRPVTWDGRVPRDSLSIEARNSLGAILSLFLVRDGVAHELQTKAVERDAPESTPAERPVAEDRDDRATLDDLRLEAREKAAQFIQDMIVALDWDDVQELVAGILRAMGYKTRVSGVGPDRGVDIFASPDGLGLEEPRIFVEVKHRPRESIGASSIRSFLGGRRPTDRCLFVSTGGFTKDAHYEAERSAIPLTLLSLVDIQELVVEHYDRLDTEARSLIPLTKVYWPLARHEADA